MTISRHQGKLLLCIPALLLLLSAPGCRVGAEATTQKADQFYAAGNYSDAELNYKKAIQQDSNYGEAHYGLALTELQLLKTSEAYNSMSKASDLLPNRQDIKMRLANLALAFYLSDPKHPADLHNHLTKLSDDLLAKDPNSFDGLRIKGHLAAAENRTVDAADLFRHANRVKPNESEIVLSLTQALITLKLDAEAERVAWDFINSNKTFSQIYDLIYKHYLFTGRLADAEKVMRAKVANNPRTARYITQLAGHYYAFGKQADMDAALRVLKDHAQDFPDAHLVMGDFYNGIGEQDEARRQFEQGAQSDPNQAALYQNRIADLLVTPGKKDTARQVVGKMLAGDPKDASSQSVIAGLLSDSGPADQTDASVQELMEALKNKPDDLAPRYHLADIGIQTRRFDQSFRYANDILALQPNNPRAKLLRAMSEQGLGKLKEAREDLNNLIKEQPTFVDAQLQLGLLDLMESEIPEATNLFQKLYQPGNKDLRPLEALVQALMMGGESDQAIYILTEELKMAPDSVALRTNLAATAAKAQKLDLAIDQYQQLASSNSKVAEFPFYLGELYDKKGDTNRAIANLQKAQQLAPRNATFATRLASELDQAGRRDQAMAVYRQVLDFQPDNPVVLNNLAFLIAESGKNLEQALKLAEKAKQKMPNQTVVDDTIGWIYLKKGMPKTAMQVFDSITRQQPANPTYHYHYGLSLLKSGDKRKAELELRSALANHPSKGEELQIRQLIPSAQ